MPESLSPPNRKTCPEKRVQKVKMKDKMEGNTMHTPHRNADNFLSYKNLKVI